jgi:hypothetical protein
MTTKPKTRKAPANRAAIDPAFAAIAEHKARQKEWLRLHDELENAEHAARKTHGSRPESYIRWRGSAAGHEDIDSCREAFLGWPNADPEKIEKEYLDAKARLATAERAGNEWDQRTGIAPLREQYERGKLAEYRAKRHLARTKPTTPAGAGALVAYIQRDLEDALEDWHWVALKTVAASLARMNREAA